MMPAPMPPELPLEQQRQIMQQVIGQWSFNGWRVESMTDTTAAFVRGRRPNHLLHAVITLFSCGLWVIPWIIVTASQKEIRRVVMVDPWGRVTQT